MNNKQKLVERLIKEDKINIEEALVLLEEVEQVEKKVYIPYYPQGQWIDPYHKQINPYIITCINNR